jgi:hypothetical protein
MAGFCHNEDQLANCGLLSGSLPFYRLNPNIITSNAFHDLKKTVCEKFRVARRALAKQQGMPTSGP